MTIIAGFCASDGILLCADSQYSGWEKTYKSKLVMNRVGKAIVAFAMSGDEDYARSAIDDCYESLGAIPDEQQTIWAIRKSIRRTMHMALRGYEGDSKPEFLIAITCRGLYKLFSSREAAIPSVEHYDCRGSGAYLANYVIRTFGFQHSMSLAASIPVAITALEAAKQHDLNSGGGSQFISLGRTRAHGTFSFEPNAAGGYVADFQRICSSLFSAVCDRSINDDDFRKRLSSFGKEVVDIRKNTTQHRSIIEVLSRSISEDRPSLESTTTEKSPLQPSQESPEESDES